MASPEFQEHLTANRPYEGLVTNYGEGGTQREGDMWSFTPTKRGAAKIVLAMQKGGWGAQQVLG